ncbi:MAG: hypothetical protein KDK44_01235 [Chlamydiia bacterium]|nr:hypothetical protein [Chlamydiia bacterium]MCP5509041.1 hypothetical protein [Chlamydiales bacterium]
MKFVKYCFLFLAIACQKLPAREISSCPQILTYIENHLPLQGILKKSGDFIYVDLDDGYVHKLIPFIEKDGFQPPPYFGSSDLVGAHITVVYPAEVHKYKIKDIQECGEKIHFSLKTCQIVHPPRWEGIDEIYLIVVDSPELDKIRQRYGLPKKEYNFHITIGVKPKVALAA